MKKTQKIRVNSTDLEKIIAFLSVITNAVDGSKKFRVVVEHDSERDMSVIEVFKEKQEQQKETSATVNSDGTILKPFLIDGGRFIVEVNLTDGIERAMFSIRGVVDYQHIPEMLQAAEKFLNQIISDNKHSNSP